MVNHLSGGQRGRDVNDPPSPEDRRRSEVSTTSSIVMLIPRMIDRAGNEVDVDRPDAMGDQNDPDPIFESSSPDLHFSFLSFLYFPVALNLSLSSPLSHP